MKAFKLIGEILAFLAKEVIPFAGMIVELIKKYKKDKDLENI